MQSIFCCCCSRKERNYGVRLYRKRRAREVILAFNYTRCRNIVNISSIYGVVAPKFEIYEGTSMTVPVEYAAIKSGQIHLTKYMAKYFKGMGIRVNSLSPGGIFDNQPKSFLNAYKAKCSSKGMLDKSDLNGTLVYLLSDLSQYVNGQNMRAPSKAKAIKLDNPAQAKPNQQPETELHILGGNE